MGENNDSKGITPFSANNNSYKLIKNYIDYKYQHIKKA